VSVVAGRRVAAIDCGTNSTRVLCGEFQPDGAGFDYLERLMRITRLGQGVDATGCLATDAMNRTFDVLREFRAVIDRLGVERVRMTATSAARDASNRDEFFDRAEEIVGVRPELLTGGEEGRLSFLGATYELDRERGPFLVVDIGGGSTEFVAGTDNPEGVLSIDIGCVRLTEKYIHSDPPAPEELSACVTVTLEYLRDVVQAIPLAAEARTFIGLAGTVTTVAAVDMGLPEYDRDKIHHFELSRRAAEDVFRTLATESHDERLANPGLEPARADVIVGGCCILVAIMRFFGFDTCLVSEADILDGLVLSQAPGRG
jgi:exopolyphosphatase/guanosine-5'-triphosphate,3'-diphosphate pyrophosphatase